MPGIGTAERAFRAIFRAGMEQQDIQVTRDPIGVGQERARYRHQGYPTCLIRWPRNPSDDMRRQMYYFRWTRFNGRIRSYSAETIVERTPPCESEPVRRRTGRV